MKSTLALFVVLLLCGIVAAQYDTPIFQGADCPLHVVLKAGESPITHYLLSDTYGSRYAEGSLGSGESFEMTIPPAGDWFIMLVEYDEGGGDYDLTTECAEAEPDVAPEEDISEEETPQSTPEPILENPPLTDLLSSEACTTILTLTNTGDTGLHASISQNDQPQADITVEGQGDGIFILPAGVRSYRLQVDGAYTLNAESKC